MSKIANLFLLLTALTLTACTQPTAAPAPSPTAAHPASNQRPLAAYLFVYFKDETHSPYFALSRDGLSFTDVNNAKPIMDGTTLAEQKGIRDPHIMRGPDNAFYMVMTDLHINGQRLGYRTTQWQRPAELYDWGNNRAIVMMKSTDLINWSVSDFRIDQAFEETKDVGCIWAPETIFDPQAGKLMVYFTMRIAHGKTKLYYSYADDTFTKLQTVPQELFKYPQDNQILDADITKVGNQYHMFYVVQGNNGGIKQAVSDHINSGYVFDPATVDPERVGREAPNLWPRIAAAGGAPATTYILMYDVFGVRPSNMGFSQTTDFKTFTNLHRFNEPDSPMKATNFSSPKHGAIIPITDAEGLALATHWHLDYQSLKPPAAQ